MHALASRFASRLESLLVPLVRTFISIRSFLSETDSRLMTRGLFSPGYRLQEYMNHDCCLRNTCTQPLDMSFTTPEWFFWCHGIVHPANVMQRWGGRFMRFRDFRGKGYIVPADYLIERTDLFVQMFWRDKESRQSGNEQRNGVIDPDEYPNTNVVQLEELCHCEVFG